MGDERPNILLITSDQHRADSLGCYQHPCVQTPHLDQLAYSGVRFENAYTDCPVCIAARTTLVTGIQSHRYGMPSSDESYRIRRSREAFLGSLVTRAGYQTHLVGKRHWHTDRSFRAGFECVVGEESLSKARYRFHGHSHDPTGIGFNEYYPALSQFPPHLQTTNWIVDQCLEFLDTRERNQPYFLWASFHDPHPPLVIHEPYYSMYDGDSVPTPVLGTWVESEQCPYSHYIRRWSYNSGPMSDIAIRKARGVYYGMITNLDHQLGRLFGRIMDDGEWDNTLVIYTSDHGEFLGDHGCVTKLSFCEAAARIPLIIRPPRTTPSPRGRTSSALVELADLLPTICHYALADPPTDVSGLSLHPIIAGDSDKVREVLHAQCEFNHMLHDGRWKYLYYADDGCELLFDLAEDRSDLVTITDDMLLIMRERLIAHLREEGNDHLVDGRLLNRKKEKPPIERLRAHDSLGLAAITDPRWMR